jgi:quinoprotein glucose dehydrogenase
MPRFPTAFFILAGVASLSSGENRPTAAWSYWGADRGFTRYSPLDRIDRENVGKLAIVWRQPSIDPKLKEAYPDLKVSGNFRSTPIFVDGVLYAPNGVGLLRAMDPGTGATLWEQEPFAPTIDEAAGQSPRGVDIWRDGDHMRLLLTRGEYLYAVDAKRGKLVPDFGDGGRVSLHWEAPLAGLYNWTAGPIVVRDVVIVAGITGGAGDGGIKREAAPEDVRGFDARTGKLLWTFHVVPPPGEEGNDTWGEDSWKFSGDLGSWCCVTADEELGYVYIPLTAPTAAYYGGHRPGDNLYSNTLVALDARTGKKIWHYQMVHHDVWEYDTVGPATLGDITVDGKRIQAVMQPSKTGFLYVFDRKTGQPVWPIEERPVPKGDVPGEWYSPTQPFPTKPPPFDRQGFSVDDLIDFTPELRAEAMKLISRYKIGPLYTPPVVSKWEGPLAMLMLPSAGGGVNWAGGSADPETGMVYVGSVTTPTAVGLVPADPAKSDFGYASGRAPNPAAPQPAAGSRGGTAGPVGPATAGRGAPGAAPPGRLTPQVTGGVGDVAAPQAEGAGAGGPLNIQGLPLVKPPWGRITAYDMNKGEIAWQIAHGETPDNVRNHPALKGLNIPRTGRQGRMGTLVTKTLLIAGEGGFFTTPSGQRGAMLRAYNKATGQEVGAVYMPAPQTGSPMTYMLDGRQYVVVAISGGTYSGELLALRLPAAK